jgi:hypothetical protein
MMTRRRLAQLAAAAGLLAAPALTEPGPAEPWGPPYTRAELDAAQARFGLIFPPDLIALYLKGRPPQAWDWTRDTDKITDMLAWPYEGLLFDVENNVLWWPEWGARPADAKDRAAILRRAVDAAPRLIPIFGHRFIPQTPHEAGNPVFSVYQSDIIYYGANLDDYWAREFAPTTEARHARPWPPIKPIPFWSEMVRRNSF